MKARTTGVLATAWLKRQITRAPLAATPLATAMLVITLLLAACAPAEDEVKITYDLTSDCSGSSVTYTNAGGDSTTTATVSSGWIQSFTASYDTDSQVKYTITATTTDCTGVTSGTLRVSISKDDVEAAYAESQGAAESVEIKASASIEL
ncbi:MAG: hypothetical protein OEZ59_05090 [Deltaproteobacteria bacterium]|nr:hypothetical protein [Deltaproteobacteria bacterium]